MEERPLGCVWMQDSVTPKLIGAPEKHLDIVCALFRRAMKVIALGLNIMVALFLKVR